MPLTTITVIYSPFHVGAHNQRVGNGPHRICEMGLTDALKSHKITVHAKYIEPRNIETFKGEIGKSFEILRRTSKAVSEVQAAKSFPIVLSGNCMTTVGIAAGLDTQNPGFVYFDAHDDLGTPSTNTNGYSDAIGLSMLTGESWHAHMSTLPGHKDLTLDNFVFLCGLRDVSPMGNASLKGVEVLEEIPFSQALVHLDLDVLDETEGKVNGYEFLGGLFAEELVECMKIVPSKVAPVSLTVCSFDPGRGKGDKITTIGVRAISSFFGSLIKSKILEL